MGMQKINQWELAHTWFLVIIAVVTAIGIGIVIVIATAWREALGCRWAYLPSHDTTCFLQLVA
jgi:hypothetical protein